MDDVRLIDANALHKVFDAMHAIPGSSHFDHLVLLGIKKFIDDTPTIDAVTVVRCRECEDWDRDWEPTSNEPGTHFCPVLGINSAPDFYCKNGTLAAVACVEGAVQQEVTR